MAGGLKKKKIKRKRTSQERCSNQKEKELQQECN